MIKYIIVFVVIAVYGIYEIIRNKKKPKLCDTCGKCKVIDRHSDYTYRCNRRCPKGDHNVAPTYCSEYEERSEAERANVYCDRWISAKEQLPVVSQKVIVFNRSVWCAYCTRYDDDINSDEYWIPMPELPEEHRKRTIQKYEIKEGVETI